ncbi:MAG: phosphate ABC transporter substrate-binding protein [Candidatus Kapabacteria bacterium]|nr:phosphate ABC transporter substrate-binding protein [Candidatus Kapabacteria bacterium]
MKAKFIVLILFLIVITGFKYSEKITIKGSDTMVFLSQKWAEKFMQKNPDVLIQVSGGGSGIGITALINGTTDICNSSRPIKTNEVRKLMEKYGTTGVEINCAIDGIIIYVNEKNGVSNLSLSQLKDIYRGKITNWKEVGGKNARIVLYSRENNSGTYVYFKDIILNGEDYSPFCQNLPGTASVVNAVSKDEHAIGYGGFGYTKNVKMLKINNVEPTIDNIQSGLYPISRYLYMYLRNQPTGLIKKYIDWILSPEGQQIVRESGFFPIK